LREEIVPVCIESFIQGHVVADIFAAEEDPAGNSRGHAGKQSGCSPSDTFGRFLDGFLHRQPPDGIAPQCMRNVLKL